MKKPYLVLNTDCYEAHGKSASGELCLLYNEHSSKFLILFTCSALIFFSSNCFSQAHSSTNEKVENVPGSGEIVWETTSNPSPYNDVINALIADSIGIFIFGWDYQPGELNSQQRIEMRNPDSGTLNWFKTNDVSRYADIINDASLFDGHIYTAGTITRKFITYWYLEKRAAKDGSLIWKKEIDSLEVNADVEGIAVDNTGLYITGYDFSQKNAQWRLEKRSLEDGALLWKIIQNPTDSNDYTVAVCLDDSAVYFAGNDFGTGNSQWKVEKRNKKDGSIIWAKTENFGHFNDYPTDIAIHNKELYISGYVHGENKKYYQWRVEKRNALTGEIIWVKDLTSPEGNGSIPVEIVSDGENLFVAGYDFLGGNTRWRLEKRDIESGNLIWTKFSNPSAKSNQVQGLAIHNNFIFLAGWDSSNGDSQWRLEKRKK